MGHFHVYGELDSFILEWSQASGNGVQSMTITRVVINGATGRMGTETVGAVLREDDMELVGAACRRDRGASLTLANGGQVPLSTNLSELLTETSPSVMVDFTNAAACMEAAVLAAGLRFQETTGPPQAAHPSSGAWHEGTAQFRRSRLRRFFNAPQLK